MSEILSPTHIVGVGASAGGLEAIENLFSSIRPDTGMAFVVIQHLSPDYKSLMAEILSKKTKMKVLRAESGMEVEANHVYLITPNNNLTIFHGKLLLHKKEHDKGINLPIDIFLKSLAEDQAEKAVAIILSGTGSDGMRGIRAVKESGGFVLVQDEDSAQFNGMPRSAISTGLVDFISPPEEMADHLLKFTTHAVGIAEDYTKKLLTDEDSLLRIFEMIRDKHKTDFTFYKMSTIIRRIKRRMTVNTIVDLVEYVQFMEHNPREITTLYKELLIGVTNFYRDKEAFQLLEDEFLPQLLTRKAGQQIRFWVAGCSTGEEAYTLAIICKECIDTLKLNVNVKIFATDVDEEAILKAGAGVYPESIAADVSPKVLSKYFFRKNDSYQVARSIREMIVFAQHDITKDPPFTNVDFISCRNLLIYLQSVLQQKTFEFFNFSLNSQGILFLGSSESVGDMMDYFDPIDHKWKIYKSRGRKRHPRTIHELEVPKFNGKTRNYYKPSIQLRAHELDRTLERFLNVMHEDFIPISIIVNEQLEFVHVVGDISKYFRIPTGSFHASIIGMAHQELSIPLSTGLQKVFQTKERISYSNIIFRIDDEKVNIKMQIVPLPEKRGQEPLAAILINESEPYRESGAESVSDNFNVAEETEQRIYDLEQELQFNRENLQATIEELETSNEELQATNEELLASNEELQSTNEELQSVNEEMHTVNAEYQLKIMQLNELSNDMDNLLNSTQIATLFLDENLEIRKFTPSIKKILNIKDGDLERPISDVPNTLDVDLLPLIDRARGGEKMEVEIEVGNEYYLMRVIPYAIDPEITSGIVITFNEITRLHNVQEAFAQSDRWHKTAASLTKIGYWEIDTETLQTTWTDEVYNIHEIPIDSPHDVKNGIEFYHPDDRAKIQEAVNNCMTKGINFDLEFRFITAMNNNKWVRSIGKAEIVDEKVVGVYGAIQDITDRIQTKTALYENQIKYEELFNATENGVVIYKVEPGNFIVKDMNRAAESILELEKDKIIGKEVREVFPEVEKMGLIKAFEDVLDTGESQKLPGRLYQDERITLKLENRIYKLPSGEIVAVFYYRDEVDGCNDN